MKFLKILLHIVASLAMVVVTMEFCARIDDLVTYGAPVWGTYSNANLFERDQFGQRGAPGARFKKWQLNSLGYRGPELRSGTFRIACIGASETFGLYEAAGQEYPRQLERDLNQWAGRQTFEVVNVAYPGQSIAAAVLRVPEVVENVKPRVAVIYPFPAAYVWLPWIKSATEKGAPDSSPVRFEWRLTERVRIAVKSLLPEWIQSEIHDVQTRVRERKIEASTASQPVMDRVPQQNVDAFHADLLKLVDALQQRGVEPVLVTHATVFGHPLSASDRQMLTVWREWIPMLKEDGFVDMEQRMNQAIRAVAAERHLVLIDAATEIPPGNKYFGDFAHFTTQGAHLMAGEIAAGLEPALNSEVAQSGGQASPNP